MQTGTPPDLTDAAPETVAQALALLRILSDGVAQDRTRLAARLKVGADELDRLLDVADALGAAPLGRCGEQVVLPHPPAWLNAGVVAALLAGGPAAGWGVETRDCIDSTNSELLRRAAAMAGGPLCMAAEVQTAGRGRRGRRWTGTLGGSLMFSVLWRSGRSAAALSGLSLAVGIAVVRALLRLGVHGLQLKWPNDVLLSGAKLAGILIEAQGEPHGATLVVIGVGINVALADDAVAAVGQPVSDLAMAGMTDVDRNRLLAGVLAALAEVLGQFEQSGFAGLTREWSLHDACQGRPVRLAMPDGSQEEGMAQGVDAEGGLIVLTAAGQRRYTLGEVSLRVAPMPAGRA